MLFGLLVAGLALGTSTVARAERDAPVDRLDRFRALAAARLGALELSGGEPAPEVVGELYALLDDEILDNLGSGSLFASAEFIQERLDALREVWGGTAFRVLALGGSGLTVVTFQLSPGGWGNSVRVYGRSGSGAALLRAIHREGVPALHEMPPTRAGHPQFLIAWVGPQSSRGSTGLHLELWRTREESLDLAWSTEGVTEGGLVISRFALGAQQVSFRYEVRYPGWKPGCDGQTEYEDVYRYAAGGETFVLARRRVVNAWHREFHAVLARFLSALNIPDRRALARLVPDGALSARLPARLEPDLACDAADGPSPGAVTVAAVEPAGGRPWSLVFRRAGAGWRLAAAAPVE